MFKNIHSVVKTGRLGEKFCVNGVLAQTKTWGKQRNYPANQGWGIGRKPCPMSGRRYARRSRECRRLLIGILNEGQFSPRFGHQTGFRCAGRPDPNFDNVPFRLYFLSPWFLPIHFYTKFYAVSNLKKSLDENRLAYSGNILSCLDAKSSETRPHGTGLSQKTHPCGIKCNSPLRSSWPEMMVSNGE